MILLYDVPTCQLWHGDSAALVLEPESVDSIVTDPPSGIGFMGKEWDSDKGGREPWIAWLAETLRPSFAALKPGGHALVWALPRTSHWTMLALESLGFEIRDVVSHLFGTGFPKSLNVSKAIDAAAGVDREVLGYTETARPSRVGNDLNGPSMGVGTIGGEITEPVTEGAKQWDGFGTALKPAAEFWILCRKPIGEKTIAANVLKYGTGALNIDACRIGEDPGYKYSADHNGVKFDGTPHDRPAGSVVESSKGRWPANVTLDEEAAEVLDEQSGESVSVKGVPRQGRNGEGYGLTHTGAEYSDRGGASRFFYVAKPSRAEKEVGLEHIEAKGGGEVTGRKEGSAGTKNARAGAGRTGGARNSHPTVKAKGLMSWLCKLITPPGGTVLDPFTGSGSTGVAAISEGFRFVGCEMGAEYIDLTAGRLGRAVYDYTGRVPEPLATVAKYEPPIAPQLSLFGKGEI